MRVEVDVQSINQSLSYLFFNIISFHPGEEKVLEKVKLLPFMI